MSDFDAPSHDEMIEGNPKVDRSQLEEANELVTALRRVGVGPPAYRIDSPYERGPVEQPVSIADGDEDEVPQHIS